MALKLKYSPLRRMSVENVYNAFTALGPQERIVAMVVGGVVILLILIVPIWMTVGKIRTMERVISGSHGEQREVLKKIEEFKGLEKEVKALEAQLGSPFGSLTSIVESAANEIGIGGNIQSMKERPVSEGDVLEERGVELSIRGVALDQLVEFLYTIESNPRLVMRVRKLKVEPKYKSPNVLNVTCELVSYSVRREEEG